MVQTCLLHQSLNKNTLSPAAAHTSVCRPYQGLGVWAGRDLGKGSWVRRTGEGPRGLSLCSFLLRLSLHTFNHCHGT